MPKHWEDDYGNIMYEATKFWEKRIPGTKFYETTNREKADFGVQWASEYQGTKLGYWTPNSNNDFGIPYIAITLGYMDDDSVPFQDRKFNRVNVEYALEITKHEIGHTIGLSHSDDPKDIMFSRITDYNCWLVMNLMEDIGRPDITCNTPFGSVNVVSEDQYSSQAEKAQLTYKNKINELNSGIETAENSLSGLEYESPDAQKKIEQAWNLRWSALQSLDKAQKKWESGVSEIKKQHFRTSINFFKGVDADSESVGNNLIWITAAINDAEKMESEYQSQKKNETPPKENKPEESKKQEEKFCFLFWCW